MQILDHVASTNEIAQLMNHPPALAPIADANLSAGQTLTLTNAAVDADSPAQSLTFSLPVAPAGAIINPTNGVTIWRATAAQAGSNNLFTVQVSDNGTPSQSAMQNFHVAVAAVSKPQLGAVTFSNSLIQLQVSGASGPDYVDSSFHQLERPEQVAADLYQLLTGDAFLLDRFHRHNFSGAFLSRAAFTMKRLHSSFNDCFCNRMATVLAVVFSTTTVWAQLAPGKFQNPINPGPDPYLDFYDGNYYLTTTQGDCIRMWHAKTIGKLKTAVPVVVWRDSNTSRSRGIWAPEFHFITNRWYVYYTATSSDNKDENHRMHVLESAGTDPLGPYAYKGRLVNPTNDHYAIDGTVFKNPGDGLWYAIWAAHPGHVLTLAPLANPWTVRGHAVVIPASGFGCAEVREGPQVLQHGGNYFLFIPPATLASRITCWAC